MFHASEPALCLSYSSTTAAIASNIASTALRHTATTAVIAAQVKLLASHFCCVVRCSRRAENIIFEVSGVTRLRIESGIVKRRAFESLQLRKAKSGDDCCLSLVW